MALILVQPGFELRQTPKKDLSVKRNQITDSEQVSNFSRRSKIAR